MYDLVRARLLNRSHANEIIRQAKGKFHPVGSVIVYGREPSICLATCRQNGRKRFVAFTCVGPRRDSNGRDDDGAINARTNFLPSGSSSAPKCHPRPCLNLTFQSENGMLEVEEFRRWIFLILEEQTFGRSLPVF